MSLSTPEDMLPITQPKKTNIYHVSADNGLSFEDYWEDYWVIAAKGPKTAIKKAFEQFMKINGYTEKAARKVFNNPSAELIFKNVILEENDHK